MSEQAIINKVERILENKSIPEEQKEEVIKYALHEEIEKILKKPQ